MAESDLRDTRGKFFFRGLRAPPFFGSPDNVRVHPEGRPDAPPVLPASSADAAPPPREPWQRRLVHVVLAWAGAFVVIGATWKLFESQQLVFAFASLGGSAVIVFGMPGSAMAQPRSLFGGHAIASGIGVVFTYAHPADTSLSIAIAMATALVAMQLTRTIHSPAGADPIIIMTAAVSPPMVVLNLGVGLALLWITGVILLNAAGVEPYSPGVYAALRAALSRLSRLSRLTRLTRRKRPRGP